MVSRPRRIRRIASIPLIFLVSGVCFSACMILLAVGSYFPADRPDPISPPETALGQLVSFDSVLALAGENRLFLFRQDNTIIATNIYGHDEHVILHLGNGTANADSEFLGYESLSPDGRLLAVNYFSERDTSDYWNPPIGKLFIVNLSTGSVQHVPTSLEGFQYDYSVGSVHWMTPNSLLIKMHRYVGPDAYSEQVTFLQYDLQDRKIVQSFEFGPCSLITVGLRDAHMLLLGHGCEPINSRTVWAIDEQGKRLATAEEKVYFDTCHSYHCEITENLPEASAENIPTIRSESVVGNVLDGSGRFYEHNLGRYFIYLNDQLVRIADGWGDIPVWDSKLRLYVWHEGTGAFYMDLEGHYRFWHSGTFIDQFPTLNAESSP
jgi:hypothetical protein